MGKPLASVIIVNWNGRRYLEECLTSLFRTCSAEELQVIVVDNASTDGSPELAAERFPQVDLIVNQANLGFSRANNIGLMRSSADLVFLINSDVRVLEGCVSTLVSYMNRHQRVGIAGPQMLDATRHVGRSCRGFPTLFNTFTHAIGLDRLIATPPFSSYIMYGWNHDSTRTVDILGGWFWVIRREALDAVGQLDERFFLYAEDMDWCKRFQLAGWEAHFVSIAASIHHCGGSSRVAPLKHLLQQQRADLQYWVKHHGNFRAGCYRIVCIVHHGIRALLGCLKSLGSQRRQESMDRARLHFGCFRWHVLWQK